MKEQNCIVDSENRISLNIIVREENENGKKLIIVNNDDLGIADFGENLDEAISNFKRSAREYLEVYPEKKMTLGEESPLLISRIFL